MKVTIKRSWRVARIGRTHLMGVKVDDDTKARLGSALAADDMVTANDISREVLGAAVNAISEALQRHHGPSA